MLISKNAKKLAYVSDGKVYVFGDDKSLITGPNEVLLLKRGKTIIIANNNVLIENRFFLFVHTGDSVFMQKLSLILAGVHGSRKE